MPRKKLPDHIKKNKNFIIRLTNDELTIWRKEAKKLNLKVSEYIRYCISAEQNQV